MKKIALEALVVPGFNKALVKVSEQTDRGLDFAAGRDTFRASNGIVLVSSKNPARDADRKNRGNVIYVRGADRTKDDNSFDMTLSKLEKLKAAVKEYNDTFRYYVKPVARKVAAPAAAAACVTIIG